ncbi:ribonuclease H-like domain-containing protein [Indiicoccus explosivorum]|uniref:ribonuclease H-like domain-containing protein n=1 Tax=Indiicoccus explosivorum TaxID=1917864 RepID=UPI000B45019E|nr:ribonuclease H-like domain-containing protein [Indiicoccus explosivorum]
MSFESKLMQMKGLLNKKNEPLKKEGTGKPVPVNKEKWLAVGLELIENDFGFVYRRAVRYPADHFHGDIRLGELDGVLHDWEQADADHPFRLLKKDRLLFFDTETTGLAGTGAYIFLAGVLERTPEGFEMIQYVLPDPSNESAFLYEIGLWRDPEAKLFSYNGKSFDWPQLLSRWTLHRNRLPPLPQLVQIDLLHGTRRIWKNELERLKLSAIEEQKLGLIRTGDTPGHLIPAIYLDAVKNGDPSLLRNVLLHNELDILSLVALYTVSSRLLISDLASETDGAYTNIGKWYADLKQYEKSADYFEHVTKGRGETAARARYLLAIQKKREGEYGEALQLFKEAAPNMRGAQEVDAWVHLAKLYEHQLGNFDQSLIMTRLAKEAGEHVGVRQSVMEDIIKREQRLMEKMRKKQDNPQDR